MKEYYYDKLLNIRTTGKGPTNNTTNYHPYEPTPYSALEELFANYEVKPTDYFVDFGCGKGRLNFFIHYYYQTTVTGIDFNQTFYRQAMENLQRYKTKTKTSVENVKFQCSKAEQYIINPKDNRFYFFNPFSVQIFMSVIHNILKSMEQYNRAVDLILYYPSKEYIFYLEHHTTFELKDEILLPYAYEKDSSERFLIYHLAIS
ncbi:methyltransferase [Ornithinibacillus sp. L9]|uniref:Methyltransferase n=1 Tax=Ornithinibacillus caprae TaxID=2678566 RepID=A0A6N8FKL4_9BACI|nr:class I SAM-dependent methyltransferase [Ornithinibacillus caprae]MUK89256.1 methyltransferase [Ornithinibacillus caprae]